MLFQLTFNNYITDRPDLPFYKHPQSPHFYFLKKRLGAFQVRKRELVPRLYFPDPRASEADFEDFCRRLLFLFKPFRDEEELNSDKKPYSEQLQELKATKPDYYNEMRKYA